MCARLKLFVVFLFCSTLACDARKLVISDLSEKILQNDKVCTLCEQYVDLALDYLAQNKTQTAIIEALHMRCSQMHNFKQQCIKLVDYYTPLFFSEISTIRPDDFCRKFNLCEQVVAFASRARQNSCEMCHRTISEVLTKLKDPNTQLEIIQLLLKKCKAMKNYEKKCKRLVFEYGPLILINAEQFLETKDVCAMLHVCPAKEASASADTTMLADS